MPFTLPSCKRCSLAHSAGITFILCQAPTLHAQTAELENTQLSRSSYSSLGLGFERLTYKEELSSFVTSGADTFRLDFETDYSGGNFSQRSMAYVSINPQWGFYIGSGSTLGSIDHEESWDVDVSDDSGSTIYSNLEIQKNTMVLRRGELNVLAVRAFQRKQSILFGARYNSIELKRYDSRTTVVGSAIFPQLKIVEGTVSEDSSAFILQGGYEFSDFFVGKHAGWRYQFQAIAGLSLYNHVRNTQTTTDSFDDSFNGFDIRLTWSAGYQFNQNIILAVALDASYQHYKKIENSIDTESGARVTESIPEHDFSYLQPSVNAMWSF